MHFINVHNNSDHDQKFEVHGFNDSKSIVVQPHATAVISAGDKQSGAIIAIHEGHEGEQAEITKDGFGGNDFIDLSNIVGAGGNLTVQQVGEPSTRKGDPRFMQHLDNAWQKASTAERENLKKCVHTGPHGNVTRIDAIKDHPELDKFVRSFADGKTYIGVGSWGGSPGDRTDNAQSLAAQKDKDILITYSDIDATPSDTHPHLAHRPVQKTLVPHTKGDAHNGPGIILSNKSDKHCTCFFYDNFWDGNSTAGANFTHPLKPTTLMPGKTSFVSLPASFKGRLQRGTQIPATWVEFQLDASNDHSAHGDISLEQGCDGAATIAATDGSKVKNGFVKDVIKSAPEKAWQEGGRGKGAG